MSLKKFVAIENVGRFHSARASGDVEFKKLTLIYGENGRGKTTACAILRSLQTSEASHIVGRKTLGSSSPPHVHLLLSTAAAQTKFQNGAWTNALPELRIFDSVFVSENVYTGDEVGTDQKRNLFRVIVGQAAVQKALRYDGLVKEIRELTSQIRDANRAVEGHLRPGLTLQALLDAHVDPEIDAKIEKVEANLRSVADAEKLRNHPGFTRIEVPDSPENLQALLDETIDAVSSSAEQQVRGHLLRHGMQQGGLPWLGQGLEFKPEEDCPFCGQDITGVALISAFKVLFSDAYRDLKRRATDMGMGIAALYGEGLLSKLSATVASNKEAEIFWQSHADFAPINHELISDIESQIAMYRETLLDLLRKKVSNPLEALDAGEVLANAHKELENFRGRLITYNISILEANQVFHARRAQLSATNIDIMRNELEVLKTLKRRQVDPLKALCEKAIDLAAQKVAKETERDTIKVELDQDGGNAVEKYEQAINRYLDLFNAGFRITKVDHNFVGGVNASYRLLINNVTVPLGDDRTPLSQASFKNTLSAGDRSTLALALFLAQLDHDDGRASRVVILDDPFSSQDRFRRNQTAIEVARLAANAAQVVVLSHDAHFLKDVSDKAIGISTKSLKLNPIGETTEICELDIVEMLRDEIRVYIDMLQTFVAGTGEPRHIIQKIRPLLEAYCRNSCVTRFNPIDILSDILAKIRAEGETHPLYRIYNDLNDLNDYTSRYHHADGSVTGVIDETELRGYCRRTLRLVGAM